MFLKMSNFDPIEVATETYIYVYPIVVMEITRQQYAAKTRSQHDANLLSHSRTLANDKWRSVAPALDQGMQSLSLQLPSSSKNNCIKNVRGLGFSFDSL